MQGGVGTNSPAAYFDPGKISCTFSLVCIVESLEAGEQELESAEVELGKDLVFNFFNYTQSPAFCDYSIDYTLTLIERNSSKDEPEFYSPLEGYQPFPPFMSLNSTLGTLKISPEYGNLLGKSYAVYV